MKNYDLSILIPARNEEWISNTVADICKNKRGKTEVIVGLDGEWSEYPIVDHPDVTVLHVSESLGQRAMTNRLAKLSKAKYVAKTDAHCSFNEGFDKIMMGDMQDNWTMVPKLKNLWVFDWKCRKCGSRWYMGPAPTHCMKGTHSDDITVNEACDNTTDFNKKLVWLPNPRRGSASAFLFNTNLQFWYFDELKKIHDQSGEDIVNTMSLQGSFFMCTREKYWDLSICDESWGSWGQQGTEVALKTWLSGGRVVCNRKCWYAHMFRTQKGFSFPYPQSGGSQERARKISQDIFLNNTWDKQVHTLSWLLEQYREPLLKYAENADESRNAWTAEQLDELKKVPLNAK